MDVINFLSTFSLQNIVITCVLTVIISILVYVGGQNGNNENPIQFVVPLPEPCKPGWQGQELEKPTIKVNPQVTRKVNNVY